MAATAETTILILDDDLGFAMWLGRALNDAGFRALPANTSQDAAAIAAQVQPPGIQVLIANLALAGSRELAQKLSSENRAMKLISIGGAALERVDARIHRPRGRALPPPERYVQAVLRALHTTRSARTD